MDPGFTDTKTNQKTIPPNVPNDLHVAAVKLISPDRKSNIIRGGAKAGPS